MWWDVVRIPFVGTIAWLCCICEAQDQVSWQPRISEPNREMTLYHRYGSNVTLTCQAEGVPQPTYKWRKDGTDIEVTDFFTFNRTDGTLFIQHFTKREEGFYMCVASSSVDIGSNETMTVSTFSPPIRLLQLRVEKFQKGKGELVIAKEYSSATLKCSNQGEVVGPNITYRWYTSHTNEEISTDEGRLFVDNKGNLHFTHVLQKDASLVYKYKCGISCAEGGMIALGSPNNLTVELDKAPKAVMPRLQYTSCNMKALISSQAELECFFSGYDPDDPGKFPVTRWFYENGTEIQTNSHKYPLSPYQRKLLINSVEEEDEGNYNCEAENGAGKSDKGVVFLDVTSKPIFKSPNGQPKDVTVVDGQDALFHCDARSTEGEKMPGAPVWYINGEYFESGYDANKFLLSNDNKTLTIKSVNKTTDFVCVQCEVKNHVGTTWGTACLTITSQERISDAVTLPHRSTTTSTLLTTHDLGADTAGRASLNLDIGTGPLIAIVVCVCIAIILIAVLGVYLYRRSSWRKPEEYEHVPTSCPEEDGTRQGRQMVKRESDVARQNDENIRRDINVVTLKEDATSRIDDQTGLYSFVLCHSGDSDHVRKQDDQNVQTRDSSFFPSEEDILAHGDDQTILDAVLSASGVTEADIELEDDSRVGLELEKLSVAAGGNECTDC